MSFDPFLLIPTLRPLLEDDSVAEIQCNGSLVFAERNGRRTIENIAVDPGCVYDAIKSLAYEVNAIELSELNPSAETRLADGSRIAICVPPASVDGVRLTIRKHQPKLFSLDALVAAGMMPASAAATLSAAVIERDNIIISGIPGCGKTTLLNALVRFFGEWERPIIIEETTEIMLPNENQCRFEAQNNFSVRDILRHCLRQSPDRLLLGEIRGAEAFDLMQLLNTGHSGSICTLHANSARLALRRFRSCVMHAGVDIPYRAVGSDIADSINLLVHLVKHEVEPGLWRREVREVVRVQGYDADADRYRLDWAYGEET